MSKVTTPSGLIYEDVKVGTGPEAKAGQTVVVHYTGWLTNGQKFDSSKDRNQPFDFPLGTLSAVHFPMLAQRPRPTGQYCVELEGGDVALLGHVPDLQRAAWGVLQRLGKASPADVGAVLEVEACEAEEALEALARRRLALRLAPGPYGALTAALHAG